jgi:hypothetical protein
LPPGGSTTLIKWDCGSCHAPHHGDVSVWSGTAAPFRLLWSKPAGQGSGHVTFDALGADLTIDEANTNHTAYRDNSSEWCAQCHTNFHETAGAWTIHPLDLDCQVLCNLFMVTTSISSRLKTAVQLQAPSAL